MSPQIVTTQTAGTDAETNTQLGADSHDQSGVPGYNVILDHADPDTDLSRVARWCLRARDQGVL